MRQHTRRSLTANICKRNIGHQYQWKENRAVVMN